MTNAERCDEFLDHMRGLTIEGHYEQWQRRPIPGVANPFRSCSNPRYFYDAADAWDTLAGGTSAFDTQHSHTTWLTAVDRRRAALALEVDLYPSAKHQLDILNELREEMTQ